MAKGNRGGKRNGASVARQAPGAVSDNFIVEQLEDRGYELTTNPREALYILRDGRMVDGAFYNDQRTEDHRLIENVFDDMDRNDSDFWDKMFQRTGVVMLVPETGVAMGLERNESQLTPQQRAILNSMRRVYRYTQFS